MNKVVYSSNNSGGSWWLTDIDWFNLERAGWKIDWFKDQDWWWRDPNSDRFLGALASSATREGLSEPEAIAEWEHITGQYAGDKGCECCGAPHYFYESDYEEED